MEGAMFAKVELLRAGGDWVPYQCLWQEVYHGIWEGCKLDKDLGQEISRMFATMDEQGGGFIDVTTMGTVVSHILHTRASHYEWTLLFGVQGAIKREKELALVRARTKAKLIEEGKDPEEFNVDTEFGFGFGAVPQLKRHSLGDQSEGGEDQVTPSLWSPTECPIADPTLPTACVPNHP